MAELMSHIMSEKKLFEFKKLQFFRYWWFGESKFKIGSINRQKLSTKNGKIGENGKWERVA
jgi:hypothetical protein